MAESIGAVIIDVKSDMSYLVDGMKKAEGVVDSSASVMINAAKMIATGYAVISFKNLIDESATLANEVGKVSEKYAIGVEELTKWQYTANNASVTNETFNDSLKDMSKNITDFQRDGSGADKAFKSLGITQEFAKKSMTDTSESMGILLQKLGEMPPSMERTTIAMELFGEEGSAMIRVADLGADAIATFNKEAIEGNIAVSNSFYRKSEAYTNAHNRLEALQSGFYDAIIEESKFLEAGTTMYQLLGDAQLNWTKSVQSGNNIFINGLEEISTESVAVFPEIMLMTDNLGDSVVTTGTAVIELADVAFSPLIDVLDLFFGATNEDITALGTFTAYAVGTTMAVENFATLMRLGVSELEVFAITISTKVKASMDKITALTVKSTATFAEFLNTVSFGELGKDYERLALKAKKYTIQSKLTTQQGELEIAILREKQMALLSNIHSIKDMDKAMAKSAIDVSKRQKEGIHLEIKKQNAYNTTALTGMKSLAKLQNKHDSISKSTKAHTKALKSTARAYKDVVKVAREWENVEKKQKDDFLRYAEDKQNALKEYYSLMGETQKLTALENTDFLNKNKPLWSEEQYQKASDRLAELSKKPSFVDGIADAFNIDENATLNQNLQDLKILFGQIVGNAFHSVSTDYAKTGDTNQAIQNYSESGALKNSLKNSGNPYAEAIAYAGDFISGALSKPLDAFQKAESNVHKDNTAIKGSLKVLENVTYPQLKVATESRDLLAKISSSFGQLGRQLSYGSASGFVTGTNFTDSIKNNAGDLGSTLGDIADVLTLGSSNGFVGNLVSGLVNGFFGTTSQSITDSGIRNRSQSSLDFINANTAEGYQNIRTHSSSLFGIVSSHSTSTNTQELPQDVTDRFAQIYADGWETILTQGISLGYDQANLVSLFESHLTEPMKIALKDATDSEVVQYLQGWFGNEFDSIIQETLPRITEVFQTSTESTMEALTRVSTAFESGNYSISRLGFDMVDFSNIVNNVDLANLNANTEDYIRGFYTTSEQTALQARDLDVTFSNLNATLPTSHEAFRNLVESLDLTTVSGRETYSTLMNTSGAFDTYIAQIENLNKKIKDSKTSFYDFFKTFDMTDLEKVNYQLESAISSLGLGTITLQNYSSILSQANQDNVDGIVKIGDLLQQRYSTELTGLQKEKDSLISANQAVIDSLANLRKSIKTNFENIYTDNLVKSRSSFYGDIQNKKYDNISNSFGTLTSQVQNSNLTDVEKFIELAKANQAVQNIQDPTADTNSIEGRISALTDVTSTIATYTQGIKTDIKDTFGADSPLFGIINKGLDKETYTQKTDENTFAWNGYQQELTHLNVNLANKTITNESEISKLRKDFVALKIEQEKANKLNAQLLAEQQKANEIAQQTANNTEKGLL